MTRTWTPEKLQRDPIALDLAIRTATSRSLGYNMATGTFRINMHPPSEQARLRATQLKLAEGKAKSQLRETRFRLDSNLRKYYKNEGEDLPSKAEWDALFSELDDLFGGSDSAAA